MESKRQPKVEASLEQKHIQMRARDRQRIETGEATPQQIQAENAWFKFKSFKILNFTA